MKHRSFSWSTKFRSIIIVGHELFHNEYNIKCHITPVTADLEKQNKYFERLKSLFELIFANTIISWKDEVLFEILKDHSDNRFVQLPKPPYDQVMAAVCFTKANAVLEGKILVSQLELSSYQGDGISYIVEKDGPEIELLDVDNWFSTKYNQFDPWWLRGDTATYDEELEKGIYTGHFSWNKEVEEIDKTEQKNAKIFKFNPRIIDGDKDKKK